MSTSACASVPGITLRLSLIHIFNNLGGIGTGIAAATLIGLGIIVYAHFGTTITSADFRIPANPRFVMNAFGVICFGLVGLELASVMGDEIRLSLIHI